MPAPIPTNGVHVRVIESRPGCFFAQFSTDNLTWRKLHFSPRTEREAIDEADHFRKVSNSLPEPGKVVWTP